GTGGRRLHVVAAVRAVRCGGRGKGRSRGTGSRHGPMSEDRARPVPRRFAPCRIQHRSDQLSPRTMTASTITIEGAWRDGDPPGRRQFVVVPGLSLERGGSLPEVRLAYETWGQRNTERDNAVLVLHALSGDSHVTGDVEPGHPTAGWWRDVVGPGLGIDTDRWFVVCTNVLGGCQGS